MDMRSISSEHRAKIEDISVWIDGETETDIVMDMFKYYDQSIYPTTNHLKNYAGDRKRNFGRLNYFYSTNNPNNYWRSTYDDVPANIKKYKEECKNTIEELDLLLSAITDKNPFLSSNSNLRVPEITVQKDSIPDLSKRLIDLYMKEQGLKCKITIEPFESSYK